MAPKTDGGGGGAPSFPLPHYEGDAGAAKAAGTTALAQEKTYSSISDDLTTRAVEAGGQVSGLISGPVKASTKQAAKKATDLSGAATLAAGALKSFGAAITTYNGKVDQLNRMYEAAKARQFGVGSDAGAKDGMTDAEKESAHGAALSAADAQLRRELEAERVKAERELEDEGDDAASNLDKGPSSETILAYGLGGQVPLTVVAPQVQMSLKSLNELRKSIKQVKDLKNFPFRNYRNLARYVLKIDSKALQTRMDQKIAQHMKQVLLANKQQSLTLAERLKNFKAGKLDAQQMANEFAKKMRGLQLRSNYMKGVKAGKAPTWLNGLIKKSPILGKINVGLGKVMPPLAILGAAKGGWDLYKNWDKLSTEKRVTGIIGNGAGAVAGIGGTAALVMGTAFPPAGAAIVVGAGVVALGTLAYENREKIAAAGKAVWEGAKDFAADPVGTTTEAAKDVGEAAVDTGKKIADGVGDVAKGIGGLFD